MAIAELAQPGMTDFQRRGIEGNPPTGYGRILQEAGDCRPSWLDAEEVVARHLPMGLSERKAGAVMEWRHPFRLRTDHPRYERSDATPCDGGEA